MIAPKPFRVTETWLSDIFVFLSDAFAKLLESGDLKGSSVRLEGVDMPFHHLLARICFHHHFSGKTHTRTAIKCSQWLRLSENSIPEGLRFFTCRQWRVYHGFITAIRVLESQYFMFLGCQVEACVGNSVCFTHVVNNCVSEKGGGWFEWSQCADSSVFSRREDRLLCLHVQQVYPGSPRLSAGQDCEWTNRSLPLLSSVIKLTNRL